VSPTSPTNFTLPSTLGICPETVEVDADFEISS
jgi:hypothetical protein